MNKLLNLALLAGIAGSASLIAAEAGKGHDVPRVVNAEEKNNEDSKSNEMENKESKENDKSTERKK